MRRTVVLVSIATALGGALVAVGCTMYGYGTAPPTAEAGTDAAADVVDDAIADGPAVDANDAGFDASCPAGMIVTSAGCIDAFEVTVDDYATFVTAKAGNMAGQPPECAWNATYAPQIDGGAVVVGTAPVGFVDWCDAFAYCGFKGKRLCGKVGGGPVAVEAFADAGQDEWFAACSHADDGQHLYPYGNAFDASTCNVGGGGRAPVGTFSSCVGGYPGLFDMSGNVQEWSNSCQDGGPDAAADSCRLRGGTYQSAATATCPRDAKDLRTTTLERVGFRCCAN